LSIEFCLQQKYGILGKIIRPEPGKGAKAPQSWGCLSRRLKPTEKEELPRAVLAATKPTGKKELPQAAKTATESSLEYVLPLPSASADGPGAPPPPFFRDFSPGQGKGLKPHDKGGASTVG